jgi:hypothetical protein
MITSAVFALPAGYSHWCQLLTIGAERHTFCCGATMDATWELRLSPIEPDAALFCSACRRNLEVRRSRAATVDMRPAVRDVRVRAAVEVGDDLEILEEQ